MYYPAYLTTIKQRGCVPNRRLATNVASIVPVIPQAQRLRGCAPKTPLERTA